MQIINLVGRDLLLLMSFTACIAGLFLLSNTKESPVNEFEDSEQMLMKMAFAYWMVHCLAIGIQKIVLPDWELLLVNLKITAALSYLLTFSCILSLPLNRMAVRQVEE